MVFLIYPDAARGTDDPQFLTDIFFGKGRNQGLSQFLQFRCATVPGKSKYGDAGIIRRFEKERVPEVKIECHQASLFIAADADECGVWSGAQAFRRDGRCVVSGRLKQR